MGVAAWYFVEDGSGRIGRVARARVERFLRGDDTLAPAGCEHARAAEVVLEVEGRRVRRVHQVNWPLWKVTEDGRCDLKAREDYARLAMQSITFQDPSDSVVSLEPAIARDEMGARFEWEPSDAQLHEVAALINSKAALPPVVAISSSTLLPI